MIVHGPTAIESVVSIAWKNGGGNTRQLAVVPADATVNDFLWRVSIAEIDVSGEFSEFPGIDRTILLWRGDGVKLRSPAWPDRVLNDPRKPFTFSGEDEVTCELFGGRTQDVNLMVRRGQVSATFEVLGAGQHVVPACDDYVLLGASGGAQFVSSSDGQVLKIDPDQFLRASNVDRSHAMVIVPEDGLSIAIAVRTQG